MHNTSELLSLAATAADGNTVSLASLQNLSLRAIRSKFSDVLSYSQARHLYNEAREQLKRNKILESRIFTRANPQLPQAIRIGIQDNASSRSYDSMFGSRSSSFVNSGSVASMFSPAGYLTELYREAKNLHTENSAYNLDKRRPDLASLLLSQENMDEEVSTLTLSNDIMLSHVEKQTGISGDALLEFFSTDRFSAATPYHQPYEALRQCVLTLDPGLNALAAAPDVLSRADSSSLLSILSNISPELHSILVENISDENAAELYAKNFSLPAEHFDSQANIRDYYNLSVGEQAAFFGGSDDILLMGTGTAEGHEGPAYKDGRLTTTVYGEDQQAIIYSLSMGEQYNTYGTKPNYLELVPVGGNKFEVRFSLINHFPEYDTFQIYKNYKSVNGSHLIEIEGFAPEKNVHYSLEIELEPEDITEGVPIAVVRYKKSTDKLYRNQTFFHIQTLPLNAYMLRLNKTIRLCRATGISAGQLESIVYTAGTGGAISDAVISQLFTALHFREKYNANLDDALVLAGTSISQFTGSTGVSYFDQLFNSPTLAGEWFSTDGSSINLLPGATDDAFARDCLLKGLSVTRSELYQLGLMADLISDTDTSLALTLANVSTLYRLSLVARLNNLTVNELYLLFTVSPFTAATSTAFVQYSYQLSHWMTDAGLSATEIWMLTSSEHPQTLTPEMLTLRSTIAIYVSAQDVSAAADSAARRRLIAPFIASTLGLSSPDLAASLVFWCENARHFTLDNFLDLLLKDTLSTADEFSLAGYLHVLAQYSLTVQTLSLSEAEVNVLAGIPGARQLLPDETQDNALARLMSLHYFHQWLNTLGRESGAVLAALSEGKLTTTLMASAMGQDETVLTQAWSCVDDDASNKTPLNSWQTIYQILQWMNVAAALNIMPAVVKQLVDIRPSDTAAEKPSWDEWKNLSRSLEAALTQRQAATLASVTAGRLSEILCSWFLANVETAGVSLHSRDDLYSYFLIDNQVSMDVKTTRLAEAISGIQLYINRALNRIESEVVPDVLTHQFFTDWEMNSRYSTWAGVSRLAYYPENYVDPLQRIGQTKMMDELLQNINQSQLSEDTVEDAFKTYLARFETIADLKVISAYHDNVNSDTGKTWFIGRSREADGGYYWRNVDMSRFSDGKLAANAWSEWVKIDTPINAWKDTVRPVIFRDRLYVVWIEQEEVATNGTSNPVVSYRYTMKLAFLRHDKNWSSPWSYDATSNINAVISERLNTVDDVNEGAEAVNAVLDSTGIAAMQYSGEDSLLVIIYNIKNKYTLGNDKSSAFIIHADGGFINIPSSGMNNFQSIASTFDVIDKGMRIIKACYQYSEGYSMSTELLNMGESKGDLGMTSISEAVVQGFSLAHSPSKLELTLKKPAMVVGHERNSWLTNMYFDIIDYFNGNLSDKYILHADVFSIYSGSSVVTGGGSPQITIPVYNKTNNTLYWLRTSGNQGIFAGSGIVLSNSDAVFFREMDTTSTKSPTGGMVRYNTDRSSDYLKCTLGRRIVLNSSTTVDSHIQLLNPFDLNFNINPESVNVSVSTSTFSEKFSARDNVKDIPTMSLSRMHYSFEDIVISLNNPSFVKNQLVVDISFAATADDGRNVGRLSRSLIIQKSDYSVDNIITIMEADDGMQYMQLGVYRIRLNTLLAPQLVSRANTGINAILSMETQQLPEPKLGRGGLIRITLPPYNPTSHGEHANVTILVGKNAGSNAAGRRVFWSGMLTDIKQSVTVFIPTSRTSYGDPVNYPSVNAGSMRVSMYSAKSSNSSGNGVGELIYDEESLNLISFERIPNLSSDLPYITVLDSHTLPLLDFNSSSALYYWELFYYVPMMCFRRLLQESKFEEARSWMNYVWNPYGYVVNGEIATWTWNCRPLEETTSWNANPLDAIDPDAVAQNDPTHYKVATFMSFIELLVTRGDMCYRELTRDALAEAKMWYVFALSVMGDEPRDYGTATWDIPTLSSAASSTTRDSYQSMLAAIEQDVSLSDSQAENDTVSDDSTAAGGVTEEGSATAAETDIQPLTANSLTGLFLPEYNPALTEMWATLRLRLYNLRHNLSIDGQPLSLSIYADPTDPAALLSSMVQVSADGATLPKGTLSLYRFPVMLERARNLVSQLTQFGSGLLSMAEHDDADELSTLLMQQGMELMTHSIRLQQRSVDETEADIATLRETLAGAQTRLDKYTKLYDEDVSTGERQAMDLADSASALTLAGQTIGLIGGAADLVPNTFGLACGGSRWGALSHAISNGMALQSASTQVSADKVSRSEMYRRRREEWEIQRNNAQSEVDQIEAQLTGMSIRLEAANLQVDYLETQQGHTLAQLEFMQRKFTNQALYSWMRGKLSAIYYQFFDIAQSCCLMAQEALRRELNDNSLTFIRGSTWNSSTAGFMAGETLLLNLAEMDKAWMERDERALEVTRTVSLAQVYAGLPEDNAFIFTDQVVALLGNTSSKIKSKGNNGNTLKISSDRELEASVKLSDLNIPGDYKSSLGATRRLKQVSVTLPALVGPYEDVRAVLSYGGSVVMPRGCNAIAVSHGMDDSGQFQLDFNDARYLPFEGIPVDDTGSLTLSFPDATGRQKTLLESLNDIILHIRYTIQS